ncbi:hypothetical protein [Burkholderia plantarii]|uniref:hypothetical protein n=1 Tax=Burkholderia plantarii TaxID=41899 RepID=UPI0006D8A20C|nr:hypothetical protein [Burkholderia plantarii]ALK32547.1 hypothetical protein bpln_2g02780 [Burkholderia plantarii]GLZ19919.1 hypothetical protein Bpla01_34480 [Burkholderia plantarii]
MNFPSGLGISQPIQQTLGSLGGVSGMASQIESSMQQVQSQVEQAVSSLMQGYMSQIQSLMQQLESAFPNTGEQAGGAGAPTGGAGLPNTAGTGEGVAGNGAIGAGGVGQIDTSGMTTQSAAGALSAYMQQNGIDPITPNQLYQLAVNPPPGTPPDVSKAAAFMLQNPDVFQAIETHDDPSTDGKAGIGDMQWAAQGGLDSMQSAQSAPTMSDGSPMTMQSAAGALSAYFQQQGTQTVDPNAMYQLAMNPPAGTPPDVQNAAKALLSSPEAYKAIETADVAGADGLSAASNFGKAAQGEVQMPASTATASESPVLEGFHPQMLMNMQGLAMNPFGSTGGFGMGGMGGMQMPKAQDDDDNV